MTRERAGSELAHAASTPHYVTLLGLCNDLLRGRWTVAVIVLCCAVGSVFVRLAQPRTYTASASFLPDVVQPLHASGGAQPSFSGLGTRTPGDGASSLSQRSSLAFISMLPGSATPLQPLDSTFYRGLLNSRAFLAAVAGSQFTFWTPAGSRTGTAADVYGVPPGPAGRRLDEAADRLARDIALSSADGSGVLTLRVRSTDPLFARAATERILAALGEQNRQMTEARVSAQVTYLTRATLEARDELRHAQDEFGDFLASNRRFVTASRVALEFRRRDADVVASRRHYIDLALQLERAKLEQSRATQFLSVIEPPDTPVRPDPRGLLRSSLAGAVGGAALAVLLVLSRAHMRRLRSTGFPDLAALEAEWRAARRLARPRQVANSPAVATVAGGRTH